MRTDLTSATTTDPTPPTTPDPTPSKHWLERLDLRSLFDQDGLSWWPVGYGDPFLDAIAIILVAVIVTVAIIAVGGGLA